MHRFFAVSVQLDLLFSKGQRSRRLCGRFLFVSLWLLRDELLQLCLFAWCLQQFQQFKAAFSSAHTGMEDRMSAQLLLQGPYAFLIALLFQMDLLRMELVTALFLPGLQNDAGRPVERFAAFVCTDPDRSAQPIDHQWLIVFLFLSK